MTADPTSTRPPSAPRARRRLLVPDVAVSTVALAVAGVLLASGISRAVSTVGYLGQCVTCNPSGALVSVGGPVVVAVAAGFAGLVLTVLRIVDRRPSWPFAVGTLLFCAVAVGIERYGSAALPLT